MEFSCAICLDSDMDGQILQCRNGHYFCASCYAKHVAVQEEQRKRPTCPFCRVILHSEPVRCLAAEQAIAAKKRAVIADVEQAEKETVIAEVAAESAAADAHAAKEADEATLRLAAQLQAKDEERATHARQKADALALALAQAEGDGDIEAQARQLAEFSRKRSREASAAVDASQMKQLVRDVVAEHGMNALTAKAVRLNIESELGLNADELKRRKPELKELIEEVLLECASCQSDLSDHPDRDELCDPNDGRLYCCSCWKAFALD